MITRPVLPGMATSLQSFDGIPVPGGTTKEICKHCHGPQVGHEWYYRFQPTWSGDTAQDMMAMEFIWDKMPSRNCKDGVAHTTITRFPGAFAQEQCTQMVKSNPHRFALFIATVASVEGQPTPIIVQN